MLFFTEGLFFFRLTQSENGSGKRNTFYAGGLMLQNDITKDNGFSVVKSSKKSHLNELITNKPFRRKVVQTKERFSCFF